MRRLALSVFWGLSLSAVVLWSCGAPAEAGSAESLEGTDPTSLEADGREDALHVDGWISPKYRQFAQAFDAERQALGAPGAAVAIIEHGRVTFAHGFGTKGVASTEPVRASTLFRIGSMTKALTATALLTLVDEGQVCLEEKLVDVVPDVAVDGSELAQVTLRQLLSHQALRPSSSSTAGTTINDARDFNIGNQGFEKRTSSRCA